MEMCGRSKTSHHIYSECNLCTQIFDEGAQQERKGDLHSMKSQRGEVSAKYYVLRGGEGSSLKIKKFLHRNIIWRVYIFVARHQ